LKVEKAVLSILVGGKVFVSWEGGDHDQEVPWRRLNDENGAIHLSMGTFFLSILAFILVKPLPVVASAQKKLQPIRRELYEP